MADAKKTTGGKKDKNGILDLEGQMKDIRQQLSDQLRCLETRTDAETGILLEIQEFFKRRAEIELEYSRNLEKLTKQIAAKHKAEKQKRESWALFSLYNWWQQLTDEAKNEARCRSVLADLYTNYVVPKLTSQSEQLQRISKRCREIGSDAHQEILRVLGELHTAMKTYQMCYAASQGAETKFRTVETQKQRFEESFPKKVGNRKHRFVEKEFEKKQAKYFELQLKAQKSRNEYVLCVEAANAALHKYFAEDLSNLADCMDVGIDHWMHSLVGTVLEARRQLLDIGSQHDSFTKSWLQSFDARTDKRRFLESHHATFTLPRKFEFRQYTGDNDRRRLQAESNSPMEEELRQRYSQLERRLRELRTENEEIWKTYETAERKLMELQRQPELKVVELFTPTPPPQTPPLPPHPGSSGSNVLSLPPAASTSILSGLNGQRPTRNTCRESDGAVQKRKVDTCEMEDYLLEKFRQYLLTSNLIRRLEARHCQIHDAFGISIPVGMSESIHSFSNGARSGGVNDVQSVDAFLDSCHSLTSSFAVGETGEISTALSSSTLGRMHSLPAKGRRKRIGRASDMAQETVHSAERRPRLFGGSLEEYVEATGEEIPLIIRSCIRMLSLYGLHHQGIFRVSGSQVEINNFKDSFERGEDPLADVSDASDVNSVAGVMKLYFREMLEPLFPLFMFDQFVECTHSETKAEVISKVKELLKTLPRSVYVVMRYLFGFLNHLSEFSDENMMDPYNLAICFGPTLLPIPESRDQVFFHNHVNELMKNMIVSHEEIFPKDDPLLSGGIWYEKYPPTDDGLGRQNDYDDDADGDAGDVDTPRYEIMDEEKSSCHGSRRKLTLNRNTSEHGYCELSHPSLNAALSPADSSNCDPSQRTFSDDLNLSNHASLQASPDSPARGDDVAREEAILRESEIWQRRAMQVPILKTVTTQDGKSSEVMLTGHPRDHTAASPYQSGTEGNVVREWAPSDDADCSSSSSERDIPIGVPIDQMDDVPPFPVSSVMCQQFQYSNGDSSSSSSYARHYSVSSDPSKPAVRRECLIGSLKRLSLSSYGVPATSTEATSARPIDQTLQGSQQDLEFIQQADFSTMADGLSPTSLKEIQVELKAVLTSLESFAHQHQKTRPGMITGEEECGAMAAEMDMETEPGGERPDLVQNLPSSNSTASAATPTSPASFPLGATMEQLEEQEGEQVTRGEPIDPTNSSGSQAKPPVPKKPSQVYALAPAPLAPVASRECSLDESSSDGYNEEAML